MSPRRLDVLVEQLPADSATSLALNGGNPPLSRLESYLADLWALWAGKDHPGRAELEAIARNIAKLELRITFENRKRTYGLG